MQSAPDDDARRRLPRRRPGDVGGGHRQGGSADRRQARSVPREHPTGATALTEAGLRPATGAGHTGSRRRRRSSRAFPNAGVTAHRRAGQRPGLPVRRDAPAHLDPGPARRVRLDAAAAPGLRRQQDRPRTPSGPRHAAGRLAQRARRTDDVPQRRCRPPDHHAHRCRLAANGQRTNGELHSTAMRKAVDRLRVDGGTPLYNAVRDAYRGRGEGLRPDDGQPDRAAVRRPQPGRRRVDQPAEAAADRCGPRPIPSVRCGSSRSATVPTQTWTP